MQVRFADAAEIDHLARLWHDVWHETHAPLQPPELIRLRTLASFRERLQAALPDIRAAGPLGAPVGFHVVRAMSCISCSCRPRHAARASPGKLTRSR